MTQFEEYERLSAPIDPTVERASHAPERRAVASAMTLHMRLSKRLVEAVADRDHNAYRRTLRLFRRAARRLERRYNAVTPRPKAPLGNIHRAPVGWPST